MTIISVVTVSSNDNARLGLTLASYCNLIDSFEFIFVIPTSDTLTLKQLNEWSRVNKRLKIEIVFDQGEGIYPAMNLGARHSTGKYLLFINSGDLILAHDLTSKIYQYLEYEFPKWVIVGGETGWKQELVTTEEQIKEFISLTSNVLLSHQTVLVRKDIFEQVKGFPKYLKVAADTFQIFRLYEIEKPAIILDKLVFIEKPKYASNNSRRARFEILIVILFILKKKQRKISLRNFAFREFSHLLNKNWNK